MNISQVPATSALQKNSKRVPSTAWKPGQSGNPTGRHPVEFSVTHLLRVAVEKRPALVLRLLDLCQSDDEQVAIKAITYVVDRIDGKPKANEEDQRPIEILIRNVIGIRADQIT